MRHCPLQWKKQAMISSQCERKKKQFFIGYQIFITGEKYILLGVLLCSIAEYFYELCCILTSRQVKIQTTTKYSQRYYSTKRLRRDLLSNMPNCYVRAVEFLTGPLKYKYRVIFVLFLGVICTLRSAVGL